MKLTSLEEKIILQHRKKQEAKRLLREERAKQQTKQKTGIVVRDLYETCGYSASYGLQSEAEKDEYIQNYIKSQIIAVAAGTKANYLYKDKVWKVKGQGMIYNPLYFDDQWGQTNLKDIVETDKKPKAKRIKKAIK